MDNDNIVYVKMGIIKTMSQTKVLKIEVYSFKNKFNKGTLNVSVDVKLYYHLKSDI